MGNRIRNEARILLLLVLQIGVLTLVFSLSAVGLSYALRLELSHACWVLLPPFTLILFVVILSTWAGLRRISREHPHDD